MHCDRHPRCVKKLQVNMRPESPAGHVTRVGVVRNVKGSWDVQQGMQGVSSTCTAAGHSDLGAWQPLAVESLSRPGNSCYGQARVEPGLWPSCDEPWPLPPSLASLAACQLVLFTPGVALGFALTRGHRCRDRGCFRIPRATLPFWQSSLMPSPSCF